MSCTGARTKKKDPGSRIICTSLIRNWHPPSLIPRCRQTRKVYVCRHLHRYVPQGTTKRIKQPVLVRCHVHLFRTKPASHAGNPLPATSRRHSHHPPPSCIANNACSEEKKKHVQRRVTTLHKHRQTHEIPVRKCNNQDQHARRV